MVKETLEEYFKRMGRIESGLVMSSNLIDKLEICSFIQGDLIISHSQDNPYGA